MGAFCLRIEVLNLTSGQEHPDDPRTREPVTPAHDRRHDDPQVRAADAGRLHPRRQELQRFPGRFAGQGELRGRAPLSAAPGLERRGRANHQPQPDGAAVPLYGDAAPARPRGPRAVRAGAPAAAGRAEPRGGRAPAGGGARPQVSGGAERGLWGGPARLRGGLAQDHRHRQRPHGHPGRAGQGAQGSLRDALRASSRAAARLVEGGAATGLAVSRAEPGQPADDAPAQSRLPCRGADG